MGDTLIHDASQAVVDTAYEHTIVHPSHHWACSVNEVTVGKRSWLEISSEGIARNALKVRLRRRGICCTMERMRCMCSGLSTHVTCAVWASSMAGGSVSRRAGSMAAGWRVIDPVCRPRLSIDCFHDFDTSR